MKVLKDKIFRTVATFLAACGVSTYFTACYGMPVNFDTSTDFKFHVVGDANGDGAKKNLGGIEISSSDAMEKSHTRADGNALLSTQYSGPNISFEIKDVDGPENGSFKTKTYTLPDGFCLDDTIEIELEPGTDEN